MSPARTALQVENPPILVCADLQTQNIGEAGMRDHGVLLLLALLRRWRAELWPVLHLKRIAQAAWFDPVSCLTDWAAPFRPHPSEMVFEHPLPSAYSSPRFAEYAGSLKGAHWLMAGCSLDETILATVIDGFHRGHRFGVITDAVMCGETAELDGHGTSMLRAIGKFAALRRGAELMGAAGSEA